MYTHTHTHTHKSRNNENMAPKVLALYQINVHTKTVSKAMYRAFIKAKCAPRGVLRCAYCIVLSPWRAPHSTPRASVQHCQKELLEDPEPRLQDSGSSPQLSLQPALSPQTPLPGLSQGHPASGHPGQMPKVLAVPGSLPLAVVRGKEKPFLRWCRSHLGTCLRKLGELDLAPSFWLSEVLPHG